MITLQPTYKYIDYIEFSENCIIDTGLVANDKYTYEVEFQVTKPPRDKYIQLVGSRELNITNNKRLYPIATTISDKNTFPNITTDICFKVHYGNRQFMFADFDYFKHSIKINCFNKTLIYDNNNIISFKEFKDDYITTSDNMHLGACHLQELAKNPSFAKIYYYKVYDTNNNLLQYFRPAIRTKDNVIGMYDEVSNTFFTNDSNGKFTAGNLTGETIIDNVIINNKNVKSIKFNK